MTEDELDWIISFVSIFVGMLTVFGVLSLMV